MLGSRASKATGVVGEGTAVQRLRGFCPAVFQKVGLVVKKSASSYTHKRSIQPCSANGRMLSSADAIESLAFQMRAVEFSGL